MSPLPRPTLRRRSSLPRRAPARGRRVLVAALLLTMAAVAYARMTTRWAPAPDAADLARLKPPEGAVLLTDRVVDVIDADTIRTARYGRVRYIGIDTPELDDPDPDVRRMAQEARRANARLVAGRQVQLLPDVQSHDRYGRLLAYVWVDGLFVNAWLVQQRYAAVMTVPPNVRYAAQLVELERDARRSGRGLWAARAR
ncbi:thermonuclease family protein [Geochorda subterranea]|uniref:Thermonuclease family protein n=1 Tax=Geochorda subterranea TaxID=3109564 RepID=A0ABZ1BML1_9FIRM|nr:thermonuclease family protein [Limnochorda sp. LNt]WRP14065.1 thermonuclease family protein [Limnochorda sp. LNt]